MENKDETFFEKHTAKKKGKYTVFFSKIEKMENISWLFRKEKLIENGKYWPFSKIEKKQQQQMENREWLISKIETFGTLVFENDLFGD